MDRIEAPFTEEQVRNLNEYQERGNFHPFTCPDDGDEKHIAHEFKKEHDGEDYEMYLVTQGIMGVNYPEMEFNQTNLVATPDGWVCPVCDYKQKWAHAFMADPESWLKPFFGQK